MLAFILIMSTPLIVATIAAIIDIKQNTTVMKKDHETRRDLDI